MSNKIKAAAVLVSIGFLTVLGFQNCSNSFSPASAASATVASCKAQSILRNAYPRGTTFALPLGSTFTPIVCENKSSYDTLVFDASKQTLTLSGDSQKVFNLETGGDGCSAGLLVGGDRWKSASGEFLDTSLNSEVIQVTYNLDIVCNAAR